jgi:hypothetical protein
MARMSDVPNLEFDTAVQLAPSAEYAILPLSPTATNLPFPKAMAWTSDVPNLLFDTGVHLARPPLEGAGVGVGAGIGVGAGVPEAVTGPTLTHEDGRPSPALFTADTLK